MLTKDDLNIIEEGNRYLLHDMEFGIGIETEGDVFIIALDEYGHVPSDDFVVFYNSELRISGNVDLNTPFNPNPKITSNYHCISPDFSIIGPYENEAHGAYPSCETKRCYINLNRIDKRIQNILFCISEYNPCLEINKRRHNETFSGLYARVFIGANWEYGDNMGSTLATIANKGPHKWDTPQYETWRDFERAYQTCSIPENFNCLKLFNIQKEADCWYLEHSEESYESINDILTKILP